ncbi:ribulose-phosphate 3-epimerase [Spirochaeta thermophila DSM 6578]|uniref:Ribulose-phosphate 3-epimerase n=1 Tax=Winmispira thermophila (strain ATCC 700085 / DSM 6578 / Z-1203) TaxID=869211 RepID=G0GBX4_WINT7|nr:ribulose-phosphate 3-epimerase [Spirochaeta thermophila]AEJ61985.1 ribulose-phosphate 3-epimerase [Spirochaeta thermophila DSM 6578]
MYKLSASILNANFARLGDEIREVEDLIDELHLDVMDGHYVDNISFGLPVIGTLRKEFSSLVFDTHLMISHPERYWEEFIEAGSDILVFHLEATPKAFLILQRIKEKGRLAGISLNPATDVRLLEPVKDLLDRVLIMTVEPGFGGQRFLTPMLRKIEQAREILGDRVDIEVDGGINPTTIVEARSAGATTFVVGSSIFQSEDKRGEILRLREALAT